MITFTFLSTASLLASFLINHVAANRDPATGHVYDVKPSDSWLAKNQPTRKTKAIQVAECAYNTRLAFPDVQVFAWFQVNHECDAYHGCPYGNCWAYKTFPQPEELVVDFTDNHVFFWHDTGGISGTGPNPIANPQTGGFGYESSLSGAYHDGKPDVKSLQLSHDSNYPTFHPESLKKWSQAARQTYASLVAPGYPKQPKCGKPNEKNNDPGSNSGAYGGYKPAPASAYHAPKPYHGTSSSGGSSGSDHPKTAPGGSNDPKHPAKPPTVVSTPKHGSQNQSGSTNPPHQGHQEHSGQAQGGKGNTNSTAKCLVFCQCISGCKKGDKYCRNTCKQKHTSCTHQFCQVTRTTKAYGRARQ